MAEAARMAEHENETQPIPVWTEQCVAGIMCFIGDDPRDGCADKTSNVDQGEGNTEVDEAELRIQQELVSIVSVLSELTGLSSRWNGEVELTQDARVLGRKPFTCRIVLNERLTDQPVRWRTLIHEALHSFSAGYNMMDYQAFLGWEEGVVEQTQRLLRPTVLERLGLQIDGAVFMPVEAAYAFNKYIGAIERLRGALHREDALEFYLDLLATQIKQRQNLLFSAGNRLPSKQRVAFITIFSEANSVLKEAP